MREEHNSKTPGHPGALTGGYSLSALLLSGACAAMAFYGLAFWPGYVLLLGCLCVLGPTVYAHRYNRTQSVVSAPTEVHLRTDEHGLIVDISDDLHNLLHDQPDTLLGQPLSQLFAAPAPPDTTSDLDAFAPLIATSSDMTLVLDARLQIQAANRKATGALGLASSQTEPAIYRLLGDESRSQFMQGIKQLVSGKAQIQIANLEFTPLGNRAVNANIVQIMPAPNAHYFVTLATEDNRADLLEGLDSDPSARFSAVFQASPDAILILRAADEIIIDFNAGFTRLLGYHREEAIGEPISAFNFWHNKRDNDTVTSRLSADHEVTDYETTLRTAQGALVHVEIYLRYVEIDNELCILVIGRDITKRISAEAALIESEEKFEKIFNQSPDGILILRQLDGIVTDINQESLNRSGFKRDDIVGKSIIDLPFLVNHNDLAAAGQELEHQGMITNREITLTSEEGDEVPHMISAVTLDLSGETHVMVLSKDISRQRADEERLRRSESRFRGIFENAPIGILLVDLQGRVFQANHTAANLLAYDQHHMYGIHVSRLVPPEDRRGLKDALGNLDHHQSSHKSERRLICQNGLEVWANFHVVQQTSSAGEPLYHIVQIADITDLKHSQQRMEQMAFYDTLTKLANRRLFQDRLNQAIERSVRAQTTSALLYLDLDNFKRVNDTLGHQIGDDLLIEVGKRLEACVRRQDTVGRTGGDEFCVLLNDIAAARDAGNIATKILNHLRAPLNISGHPLIVTSSIGITIVPADGLDPNVLMRNADLAMYKAKERGKNNFQYYSEDLNVNAVRRLRIEFEMRQALEHEEFELYYQPKVSISTGKVVGVESLIRWHHPERGFLTPNEFIDVAEDTGIISEIGSWVIRRACEDGAILNQQLDLPLQIAINISPRQFRDPNLITTVRQSLRETGLDAELLEIEITETMLMQDISAAQIAVERFQEIGVKLAIDDFGTGYSSLSYLKKFQIKTVKVDRSFVMDIPQNQDDMAITSAVIAMAHELNMEVVAEGVETSEQFDFLATHNCEYAQGWLFAKPLPLGELVSFIRSQDEQSA